MEEKGTYTYGLSDEQIIRNIGQFIKKERIRQKIKQEELATNAGVARSTVSLLENGKGVQLTNLIAIMRQLNLLRLLEVFTPQDTPLSPIQIVKMQIKEAQRVRKPNDEDYLYVREPSDW